MQTFISLWNKEDTTSLVNDGIRWVFSNYIYSSNYFKLKLDSYGSENHNKDCYEIIYTNGIWSKIRRIITANSDDNNEELVNINGNLTVTETINGFSFLNNAIVNNTNINSVIYGSDSTWKGPALWLTKYNASKDNGYFDLIAQNANLDLVAHLTGRPNGELTWDNKSLSDVALNSKSITNEGYISFSNGLIVQWSRYEPGYSDSTALGVGYPINMKAFIVITNFDTNSIGLSFVGGLSNINKFTLSRFAINGEQYSGYGVCYWFALGLSS